MTDHCACECCDHMPDTTAFLESFKDGTFLITPPEWYAPLMVGAFKQTLDATDAPNYLEMTVGEKGDGRLYKLILCRPGHPSPHQLREEAEAERDRYKAALVEIAHKQSGGWVEDVARAALDGRESSDG